MKSLIKRLFFCTLNWLGLSSPKASILMYHSIDNNQAFFTVSPKNFRQQLEYLIAKNFRIIKLSELIKIIKEGGDLRNIVCLTFDDGYQDNYINVFPLINELKLPVTIFLATGLVLGKFKTSDGQVLDFLNWSEIKEMYKSDLVEFLPHTQSHLDLSKATEQEITKEIDGSLQDIIAHDLETAKIIAYPKGRQSREVIDILRRNQWEGALTVQGGLVSIGSDIYKLPRNSIDSQTSFCEFKAKLGRPIEIYFHLRKWIRF